MKSLRVSFVLFCLALTLVCSSASFTCAQTPPAAPTKITNQTCLECHSDIKEIDPKVFADSVHGALDCVDCHSDIKEAPHQDKLAKVNCGACHEDVFKKFNRSIHAQLAAQGKSNLPSCWGCHGTHNIFPVKDERSQAYHLKSDAQCINCHANADILKQYPDLPKADFVNKYLNSAHGKGIHLKGLNVSATCTDCHGVHEILPSTKMDSKVAKANVPVTCGKCHEGILNEYVQSIHGQLWQKKDPKAPVCTSCHTEHGISLTNTKDYQLGVTQECGNCHQQKGTSYVDTFHGQASSLGFMRSAKCADCHSAHQILPASDPRSTIHKDRLAQTCGRCHQNVNAHFIQYDPHSDVNDQKKSRMVYWTYQFMKWLLVIVFTFWGLHTGLWFQRSVVAIFRCEFVIEADTNAYVRRFSNLQCKLHGIIVVSFIGLVLTGLPLKYHYAPWAQGLCSFLGGLDVTRYFHRLLGIVTIGYFVFHIAQVLYWVLIKKNKTVISGPESMMPRKKDWTDFVDNVKWFFYQGPPPKHDRWTYFEKFDYMAVFWGVCVIGLSGLVLWLPSFFTQILPGDFLNVAFIVHSDEALLALAFIFIVHFFHNHLRVENFPIDLSIFSGVIPLERFRRERPQEYERLVREGKLKDIIVPRPSKKTYIKCMIFGYTALGLGLAMITAIFITFILMPR